MSKNYIGFVNDHSGSMDHLAEAAMQDYNVNIAAVKDAASREMLDTVVSVVGVGYPGGSQVTRQVQISNPHVLKPITNWSTAGGTPLWDGIGSMIELLKNLPDSNDSNVSFLIMVTTDGEELSSRKYNHASLKALIADVSKSGQWTFAFRVPSNTNKKDILALGIPDGNIQFWDTTTQGLAASTAQTTAAMDTYFAARSSGSRSSNTFYANAATVNTSALTDLSKKVSLYVVPDTDNGIEIRPFILRHRMEYLKGAAFYQLTKTESRVSHTKQVLIRERSTGKIFGGKEARVMIGLPQDANARLHPGDHKNFDLFIQSESVNRKLVAGTGVLYWAEIGTRFTEADLAYLKPKAAQAPAVPAVVQLPSVPVSTKPTPSPIPVTKKAVPAPGRVFDTREKARQYSRQNNGKVVDLGASTNPRWLVITE